MVAMDSPCLFMLGVVGGVPPSLKPTASGYVHQKCIPVVLGYKKVRCPPYIYRSLDRSRRSLPGTTKKPVDNYKDTSVMAVGKFFYLRKIFYGCNRFPMSFYGRGRVGRGVGGVETVPPPQQLCPLKVYTSSFRV